MKEHIKISIITPTFNQGKYLEETICSVLNQNYPNLEFIVVDGKSSDNTHEIVQKYRSHIHHFVSGKDNGQSEAINKGLQLATGDVVAWLNGDDLYLPDALQLVNQTFLENPDAEIVLGDVINFMENEKKEHYHKNVFEPYDFLSRVSIHQPGIFWKRKLHLKAGWLDESLYYLMDYDLWMRFFFNFKHIKINFPLAKFRIHSAAKTFSNPQGLYLEYRKIFSRFLFSTGQSNYIQLLKDLNIFENDDQVTYDIPFEKHNFDFYKIVHNYIYQCAIQEYSWQNYDKAEMLFKYLFQMKFPSRLKPGLYLIKNKLHLRDFTKHFR